MPTLNPTPALPGTKQTAVDPQNPAANEQLAATEANQLSGVLAETRSALGAIDDGSTQTVSVSLSSRPVARFATASGVFAAPGGVDIYSIPNAAWALPSTTGLPDGTLIFRAA